MWVAWGNHLLLGGTIGCLAAALYVTGAVLISCRAASPGLLDAFFIVMVQLLTIRSWGSSFGQRQLRHFKKSKVMGRPGNRSAGRVASCSRA